MTSNHTVPDLSTTDHIERTLTSKLQEVKGAVTEQWKQIQVRESLFFSTSVIGSNVVYRACLQKMLKMNT